MNYIEKKTNFIRNQQYRNLEQPKITEEIQKDSHMQIESEQTDCSLEGLLDRLDKVLENQKMPKNDTTTREIDSKFTDLDECNLDFYFLTQDKPNTFGILEDIEVYCKDGSLKIEWKVDKRQIELEAEEFSKLKKKIGVSVKNMGKTFKNSKKISKDLDRFIFQRIPFYFEEYNADGLHMIKLQPCDQEVFKPLGKSVPRCSSVKLRFIDPNPEETLPSQQSVSRRTVRKKRQNLLETLRVVLQPSSSDRETVLKSNQRI